MTTIPKELGKPFNPGVQVNRLRFSPCGKALVAACFDGTVRRWIMTGKEPKELPVLKGHNGWVSALAIREDRFYTADSWGRIIGWGDYLDQEPKKVFEVAVAHDGWIRALAIAGDGVVSCGRDGFLRAWADDGKKKCEVDTHADQMSLATAAGKVVAGDNLGTLRVFDVSTLKEQKHFEVKELHLLDRIQDVGGVRCMAFNDEGTRLYVGGAIPKTGGFVQGTPLVVELEWPVGKRLSQFKGTADTEGFVHDMLWHPEGFIVGATSGQPGNGKMFCWKPGEAIPFNVFAKMANCHSNTRNPVDGRLALAGTNSNSSGNGRVKSKDGDYSANSSPIQLFEMGK